MQAGVGGCTHGGGGCSLHLLREREKQVVHNAFRCILLLLGALTTVSSVTKSIPGQDASQFPAAPPPPPSPELSQSIWLVGMAQATQSPPIPVHPNQPSCHPP